VAARHRRGVQRHHLHGVAQPDLLARQRHAGLQLGQRVGGVEEQLRRVVAGLAVDLDGPGVVGRPRVVEPVVVGEPGVGLGDRDQLAGALVVEARRPLAVLVQHLRDPVQGLEVGAHRRDVGGVADVDVGDLVVGHGEGARGPRVQVLHAVLGVHLEPAPPAQQAVDVDRAGHPRDAVLADDQHGGAPGDAALGQLAGHPVDVGRRRGGLRAVGAVPLQVVVEVRQVDERQVRPRRVDQVGGRARHPARRRQPGGRPPVGEQRERSEPRGQLVVQRRRAGVAVGVLAPVGPVDRPGGDQPVGVRTHRVPPADVGDGVARVDPPGGLPHLLALHQPVVLAPQQHLAEVAEVPAVADDPGPGGWQPRQHRRLRRARDRGQHGAHRRGEAGVGQGAQPRHAAQQRRGEPDDVDQHDGAGGCAQGVSARPRAVRWSAVQASSAAMPATSAAVGSSAPGWSGRAPGGSVVQV
jgi:hypothetical protein